MRVFVHLLREITPNQEFTHWELRDNIPGKRLPRKLDVAITGQPV